MMIMPHAQVNHVFTITLKAHVQVLIHSSIITVNIAAEPTKRQIKLIKEINAIAVNYFMIAFAAKIMTVCLASIIHVTTTVCQ